MQLSPTRRFFEEMLPVALHMNRALFNIQRGSICIAVQDEGAWTIRFGRYGGEECYTEELDEEADCVMVWQAEGFEKMLLQQPLAASDEPDCYGLEDMIGVFLTMLKEPSRGQVGLRSCA